jgi:PAS domain S-box-containing protein
VANDALRNVALLRWFNELSSQGIFTTDRDFTIRSWNRWLERVTGNAEDAVLGRPLFDVCPELVTRNLDRYYRAALAGEPNVLSHRFHNYLIRVTGPHGTMPQTARVAPLVEGDAVVGTITVIDDVSERVNSEAELRRQIAAAESARSTAEDALRVKDEFLATLSHELRTPLNAVLGWTHILLGQKVDRELMTRALHVIDRNAVAQARLIDDMLDMARIVTGKLRLEMAPVDLVAAARAAVDVVAPSAQAKNVAIATILGSKPRLVTGDADRIQQIVWNVLSNAVKFTPGGGRITLRIEQEEQSIRLTVKDTGKGITPDFLPFVFERFLQANSSVSRTEGGLGLGLALVRQLVELHGGQITAASAGVNAGSTFTITLPAIQAELLERPASSSAIDRHALTGARILVVDDDGDWRDVLVQMLEKYGADVSTAGTTPEAIERLDGAGVPPDVIVADIGLPGENGYELIRQVRARGGRRIPALAVTAYAAPANRREAIRAGFDHFRAKPITPEGVIAAVAGALQLETSDEPNGPNPSGKRTSAPRRTPGSRRSRR